MVDKATVSPAAQQKVIEVQEKELRDLKKQNEALETKNMALDKTQVPEESNETQAVMANLLEKVTELEKQQKYQAVQPIFTKDGKKPKYREVLPEDIQEDTVTFSARCVMKVISSYRDENGVERLPPFKIIELKFAASDIRQDGKEQEILNFCNYTTKLKPEIEYLRACPEYGITFGENMNEVAGHNPREYQYKVKAAAEVTSMSTESVLGHAEALGIKGWHSMGVKRLKDIILKNLVDQYINEESKLQDKLVRSMGLRSEKKG